MSRPTVFAVMRAAIEIPVQTSGAGETLEQLYEAAKNDAEGIIRCKLPNQFRLIGKVEFSHAVIKESP